MTLAAQSNDVGGIVGLLTVIGVLAAIVGYGVVKGARERSASERVAAIKAAEAARWDAETERRAGEQRVTMSENDRVMFEQHRRINELHISKLEAEVALLQSQVKARSDDDDRLHAAKEYHELNVEKTKLEIDSLRLHIAEQRKRLDEFGLGGA